MSDIYILSKMTNSVNYRTYRIVGDKSKKAGILPVPLKDQDIIIKGGADRPSNKGGIGEMSEDNNGSPLWTPDGVVTPITDAQYERLKDHWLFQKHLEGGYLKVLNKDISHNHKHIAKEAASMATDGAKQLSKSTVKQRISVKTPEKEVSQGW